MEEKQRINPLIPLCVALAIILAGVIVFGVFIWSGKAKAEAEAAEYKAKYEELVKANEEAEQAAKAEAEKAAEEEKKAQENANSYQTKYNSLVSNMFDDAIQAEKLGNLIKNVWHNAIWETEDSETDKFTKVNGEFVSDFNIALNNLFDDEAFRTTMLALSTRQQQARMEMKGMMDPPEGFENAFKALENMYYAYLSLTDIVLYCDGSYDSFSKELKEADENLINLYHTAELYVKTIM